MQYRIGRRQFVAGLVVLSASAIAGKAFTDPPAPDSATPWTPVGSASKFKPNMTEHVVLPDSANDEEIFVIAQNDGKFSVLSARCTHLGCNVEWKGGDKQFVCPCHGGRYNAAGAVSGGPPQKPLKQLAVKVDNDGILYVQLQS